MQEIPLQERVDGSHLMIVGGGASDKILPWPLVRAQLQRSIGRAPHVLVTNAKALGTKIPRWACSVGPQILESYQQAGFARRGPQMISNAPERTLGSRMRQSLARLYASDRMLVAPGLWPALASGPLALFAAYRMGYENVYVYACDGSVESGLSCDRLRQVSVWEHWMRSYIRARPEGHRYTAKIMRVWPEDCPWASRPDPLQGILSATLSVENPSRGAV